MSLNTAGNQLRISIAGGNQNAVSRVLKKYGSLSHLWDFGVSQNALTYAASHTAAEFVSAYPLWHLYQDTAGTVPACKINDPIGLCLDQPTGVVMRGAELVTNGDNETSVVTYIDLANGSFARDTTKYKTGTASAKFTANSATSIKHQVSFCNIPANKSIIVEYDYFVPTGSITLCRAFDTDDGSWFTNTANGSVKDQWVRVREFRAAKASAWNLAIGTNLNQSIDGQSFWLDNISVREVIGAHASQATTMKRPILSGRVNLLTATEGLVETYITALPQASTSISGYAKSLQFPSTFALATAYKGFTQTSGVSYTLRVVVQMDDNSAPLVGINTSGDFCLQVNNNYSPGTVEHLGNNVYSVSVTYVSNGHTSVGIVRYATQSGKGFRATAYDLRPANSPTNIPAYQRVTSATDYDTVGFPVRALFDGVDDCLVVPSLDLSITDRVTVVAGVTKLSDAATGVVYELTNDLNSNNGSFYLLAPRGAGYTEPAFSAKGTLSALAGKSISSFPAPSWEVLSAASSISSDYANLRANGASYATSASDQGTGNFSASTFNIGQRGGTSLPFNGAIQSLAVIGNLLPDGEVQILEAAANAAMGRVY